MKKLLCSLTVALLAGIQAIALPDITQFIPDVSGEYVFYQDTTFERKSYTGFVFYNESTYGVRYYAPEVSDKKKPLPEKDIQLYFTIDASQNHFEPTGERIAGTVTPDDTDIINYLHDMMYELTARRKKAGIVSEPTSVTQNFQQFGGDVTLSFNPLVPLFNLESITTLDGTAVFSVVTTGQLSGNGGNSSDTSFTDFKGFPQKVADKTHTFKPSKKAVKSDFSYSKDEHFTQSISLDDQWKQYADNFFFLGKNALVTFDVAIPQAGSSSEMAKHGYAPLLARSFARSGPNSYADWTALTITKTGNRTIIRIPVYEQTANNHMQTFKIIDEYKDGSAAFLLLTVYEGAYEKNKAYFESVLSSYSVTAQ
ncbi:MAG: hypothetical protein K6G80_03120 [Treponema sp.]|nr:hypothetical protein [Treponema sp.]